TPRPSRCSKSPRNFRRACCPPPARGSPPGSAPPAPAPQASPRRQANSLFSDSACLSPLLSLRSLPHVPPPPRLAAVESSCCAPDGPDWSWGLTNEPPAATLTP